MRAMRDADDNRTDADEGQDALGAFYVIGAEPNEVISGWIALEDGIDEFFETVFEEMEFTLQVEVKDQKAYSLFYVDTGDRNALKRVVDDKAFDELKKLDKIFLMMLHHSINVKDVESNPRLKDWLEETDEF
jgi:hypothetical protein